MAASASFAFAPSGPPACAMSGRPPPPLPPSASDAARTRSTALTREVRSSVTPTTSEALPSATVTNATTPEPIFDFASSASAFRSLAATSSTQAQHGLDAGDLARRRRRRSRAGRRARAPCFASDELAFEPAAFVRECRDAGGQFRGRGLEHGGGLARGFGLAFEIAPRALGGQRLDAAHAGRDRGFREDR